MVEQTEFGLCWLAESDLTRSQQWPGHFSNLWRYNRLFGAVGPTCFQ
jgi:hypothetical protein